MGSSLPVASSFDTGRALRDILLPIVAQGAVLRRPRLTQLGDRLQVDDRALRPHRLVREVWLDGRSDGAWPLIPFSAGPAVCPGRNVVLLTNGTAVSDWLRRTGWTWIR